MLYYLNGKFQANKKSFNGCSYKLLVNNFFNIFFLYYLTEVLLDSDFLE